MRALFVVGLVLTSPVLAVAGNLSSSLEPSNLRFDAGLRDRLRWDAATGSVTSYGVYRGTIGPAGMRAYDHGCEFSANDQLLARDYRVPVPGEAFYYLVTGLVSDASGAITAGPLGIDSRGGIVPESTTFSCGARVFVDPTHGSGTGEDWSRAYGTIAAAIAHAGGSGRGIEIWVKGNPNEAGVIISSTTPHPGVTIYGGFAGTEVRAWQRQSRSDWNGLPNQALLTVTNARHSLRLDGFQLQGGSYGILHQGLDGSALVLANVTTSNFSSGVIRLDSSTTNHEDGRLTIEDCTFSGSSGSVLWIDHRSGTLTGRVLRSVLSSSTASPLVDAQSMPDGTWNGRPAVFAVDFLADRFEGGSDGLSIKGNAEAHGGQSEVRSLVASNVFTGQSGSAIALIGQTWIQMESSADVSVAPSIVGNTIDGAGDSGISTLALSQCEPEFYGAYVSVRPAAWDNIITGCAGYAIREDGGIPECYTWSVVTSIGNDLFGNAGLYLRRGTEASGIDEVNTFPGARDNLAADPLYRTPSIGDFHLQPGSPCLGRGHGDRPGPVPIDVDTHPRPAAGGALGAYEF